MRRLGGLVSGVAVLATCAGAGPALAQDGAGLYEPFPEAPGSDVSRDFLTGLPAPGPDLARELSEAELGRGVRVTGPDLQAGAALPARVEPGPARRAYPSDDPVALGWIAALGLAAAALAAPALLRLARA
jgi:hypothetical protein